MGSKYESQAERILVSTSLRVAVHCCSSGRFLLVKSGICLPQIQLFFELKKSHEFTLLWLGLIFIRLPAFLPVFSLK